MKEYSCFKAYDIRGAVPEEFNAELAYKIARSYVRVFPARTVVVGYDARLESKDIADEIIKGLNAEGTDTINIGLCGTEEVYWATIEGKGRGVGGGIMVTASHNPKGYCGMKLVKESAKPISFVSGLHQIRDQLEETKNNSQRPAKNISNLDKTSYIKHLLSYIDLEKMRPLRVVVNPGNGCAGPILKLLEEYLPFEFIYLNETPDGHFPKGVANPMLPEFQVETAQAVVEHNANLGLAWDGDFDRCFFFSEDGKFIDGYYVVGLLAEMFLSASPKEKVVHDARLVWNTEESIRKFEGIPVKCVAGHSFIKEKMREESAIYGGEISAHHYFRDFSYCDSGMIPWLLITQMLSSGDAKLSEIVTESVKKYPCSGEINYRVKDSDLVMSRIHQHYLTKAPEVDKTDGLSLSFDDWRFNLRASNTEPLLRLNAESKSDKALLARKIKEIEDVILGAG